jgi:OmpA-OmpF porin, OOP family
MSTNLVEQLKEHVSTIVLKGESEHVFEKDQVLSQFYPILLTILKSKPHLIEGLSQQLNPALATLFDGNTSLKNQFLSQFGSALPTTTTEHVLEQSIAPSLNYIRGEAGSGSPEAVVHLIEQNTAEINQYLPAWAAGILASLGIPLLRDKEVPKYHAENDLPTDVSEVEREMGRRTWIPFIILLILAAIALFLYKHCREPDSQKPLVHTQQASTKEAIFELNTGNDGGLMTCQLYLNNPQYVDILQKEVKQIFSAKDGCGVAADNVYQTEFVDQDIIPSVLKMVQGTPNLALRWVGNQLSIQAQNPADAERVANQIRNLANNITVVTASTAVSDAASSVTSSDAITAANTEAEKALASIQGENISALDVATALNLQIINFATASSEIPVVNQSILDQAAALMKRASHVNLKVIGHTDAQGNADANKALSQQRAQAVVNYLVSKGVDPAQLQAVGMGQTQPRADNNTEEGRFKNRRIEFEVVNTETGTVRSVDAQGVNEQ